MSENRRLITSAAIPDPVRLLLFASLLLLPSVSRASILVSQFGESAPRPIRSQHFIVDTFNQGSDRADILESVFTAFIDVTNTREDALPPLIRVDIFPDEAEFRKKLKMPGGQARTSADHIETYEQGAVNNVLVQEAASALFLAASGSQRSRNVAWLRAGVGSSVMDKMARVDAQDSRRRAKALLTRSQPIDFETLVGREELGGDAGRQERFRATSASLVAYMNRQDRGLGLKSLLSSLGEGRGLDDAVSSAYAGRYRSMDELYDRWLTDEMGMTRPPPPPKPAKLSPPKPKKKPASTKR